MTKSEKAMKWNRLNREKWRAGIKKWCAKNPKKLKKYRENYINKNPERFKCRCVVNSAIYRGSLKREHCSICNKPNAQAHHDDYSKPYQIIWLCKKHHDELHYSDKKVLISFNK